MTAAPGQRLATDGTADVNALDFVIRMALGRAWTSTPVQVVAVHGGGVAKAGTVDVLPLVNQIDSEGVATPHAVVYGLPFARLQGAGNCVICDPVKGDVGVAVFASRDISSVKANGGQANPGSYRRFDAADGMYVMKLFGATPTQYVQFLPNDAGVVVTTPGTVTVNAPLSVFNGNVRATGTITAGYGGADQVGVQTHTHAQPNDSHGDTEAPTSAPTAGT